MTWQRCAATPDFTGWPWRQGQTGNQPEVTMKIINQGNNEALSRGVIAERDGTFTALGFSASKNFKTRAGAERWLARR